MALPSADSRVGVFDPLLGRAEGVQYVPRNTAGSAAYRTRSGSVRSAPTAGIRDLAGHAHQVLCDRPATGAGADSDVFPIVLRKMFGLPMKVVTGYHSAADVVLAITRKEVDGRCGWSWSSMMAWNKDMYQSKAVTVALQLATQKLAELPDTPSIVEVARDAEQQAALKLIPLRAK